VEESETKEFSELSERINTTVDALKELIGEAERRMEYDLATARAIQEGALPRTFPAFPEIDAFDIFAAMDAAKEVGGDFFDFFLAGNHTLGFLIADVSGKGIPGALFMMAAEGEIEHRMLEGLDLARAVSGANDYLYANNDADMFVTVWAATLDWETGVVTYVNAGHNFPLQYHAKDSSWEWIKKTCGMFLGTFDLIQYHTETLVLEPGDKLVLYTDGVNEAFSANGEEYGNARLEAFLVDHSDRTPKELTEELRADVAAWSRGAEQSDDITILALEYKGA
jgi:serine phosphatase RsbU (regulator of sigma subunit)